MSEETNVLDLLVSQVADDGLRTRLAREIELLRDSRRFGLVFDRHLPESVRLTEHPVRKGVRVGLRDESTAASWRVLGFTDRSAAVAVLDGDGGERSVDDLVVIREFGERVYPGLVSVGRVAAGEADAPWHPVICGENYHVLQALRSTHRGKVDLIYIDPPYNTGGKRSWLYNDRFVDKTDRAKSSKWLSFMERRLVVARDLLKPSGAIFVSIGDDEQHRLRMLMDQVYGAENCVATLAVEMSTTSGPKTVNAQQGTIVKNVEFVLIYRKSEEFDALRHTPLFDSVKEWDTHYSLWLRPDGTLGSLGEALLADVAVRTDIEMLGLLGRGGTFSVADMDTLLTVSEAAQKFVVSNLASIARTDRAPVSCQGQTPGVGRYITFEAPERSYLLTTLPSGSLQQVVPLSLNYRNSDDYQPRFGRTVIRGDLWKGFHQDMGNVAKEGGVAFDNGKKPRRLIKQLIRWANNSPDAVVLDFFAGSGTTAHAVLEMNAEDGGRRQAILVTNNEVGIAAAKRLRAAELHPGQPEWERHGVFEAVTRPRVEAVVAGRPLAGGRQAPGLPANVEFFRLTYLDPNLVRRGREYEHIAPLMWLEGGATGPRIDHEPDEGWALTPHYGVLFDPDALGAFSAAAGDAAACGAVPGVVFVITDSPSEYQAAAERLPAGVQTVQLYEDYLANYTINVAGAPR